MAVIEFQCAACGTTLKAGPDRAGQRGKCSRCGEPVTVPSATAEPATTPEQPDPPRPSARPADRTWPAPRRKEVEEETEEEPQRERRTDPRAAWRKVSLGLLVLLIVTAAGLFFQLVSCVGGQVLSFSARGLWGMLRTAFLWLIIAVVFGLLAEGIKLASYALCCFVPPQTGVKRFARVALVLGIVSLVISTTTGGIAAYMNRKAAERVQGLIDDPDDYIKKEVQRQKDLDPQARLREVQEEVHGSMRWLWVTQFTGHLSLLLAACQSLAFALFLRGLAVALEAHEAAANCLTLLKLSAWLILLGVVNQLFVGAILLSPRLALSVLSTFHWLMGIFGVVMNLLYLGQTGWFLHVVHAVRQAVQKRARRRPRR